MSEAEDPAVVVGIYSDDPRLKLPGMDQNGIDVPCVRCRKDVFITFQTMIGIGTRGIKWSAICVNCAVEILPPDVPKSIIDDQGNEVSVDATLDLVKLLFTKPSELNNSSEPKVQHEKESWDW